MGLKWYGDKCKADVSEETRKRIHNAAIYWVRHAKNRLGTSGYIPDKNGMGAFIGRSFAGEYPRKQSGHLRRNVMYEMDTRKPLARVGTNVKYGRYLEEGTRRIAPRPWMTLTNAGTQTAIRGIIQAGRPI